MKGAFQLSRQAAKASALNRVAMSAGAVLPRMAARQAAASPVVMAKRNASTKAPGAFTLSHLIGWREELSVYVCERERVEVRWREDGGRGERWRREREWQGKRGVSENRASTVLAPASLSPLAGAGGDGVVEELATPRVLAPSSRGGAFG
jgi:hypothetical protein